MSEWKEHKLGDLVELVTKGTTPSTVGGVFKSSGIYFIKSEALSYDGRIDKNTFVYIDSETHNKLKRSQLQKDDILFSMAGIFLGKTGIVTEDMLPANTNQAVAIIRLDKNKALPSFIKYNLRQESTVDYVNTISGQSAQPNINFEEIKSIGVLLPPIPQQKSIAEVLSSLDDKIDLLHQQNKTLEALAETLFRQWFVEEVSKEWKVEKLSSYIKLVTGYSYRSDDLKPSLNALVTLKNFDRDGGFRIDGFKEYIGKYKQEQIVVAGDLIVAHTDITQEAEVLGNPAIIIGSSYYKELIISTDLVKVIPTSFLDNEFLYFLMKTDEFKHYCLGCSNGTTVLHLSKKAIPEFELKIPPISLVQKYSAIVKPLLAKKQVNQNQINQLETLRNNLLPKLMSGAVTVSGQ